MCNGWPPKEASKTEPLYNRIGLHRVCLMFRGKFFEREYSYFRVLNEVYLKFFLHKWIVNRETNLTSLINSYLADGYCSITVANHGLSTK